MRTLLCHRAAGHAPLWPCPPRNSLQGVARHHWEALPISSPLSSPLWISCGVRACLQRARSGCEMAHHQVDDGMFAATSGSVLQRPCLRGGWLYNPSQLTSMIKA